MTIIDEHALSIPTSNHWDGREGHTPKFIVLHGTAGGSSAHTIATYFQSTEGTAEPVSVNDIIGQDGTIVAPVAEDCAAYGNGILTQGHDAFWDTLNGLNPNLVTISIEHVKPSTDNSDALTPAQKAASFGLVERQCARWNIPKRKADANGGICFHSSLDPVQRAHCPGPYPLDELFAYLNQTVQEEEMIPSISLSTPRVSDYFEPSGDMWKCKQTGMVVGHAILDFYRIFGSGGLCGITYAGLPLTNEISVGNGNVIQRFERIVLGYGPDGKKFDNPPGSGNVFVVKLYEGNGIDPRMQTLQKEVNALSQQLNTKPDIKIQAQLAQAQSKLQHIEEILHT